MVAHRLIEIHRIKQWRVKAGQQFFGDNQNLRLLVKLGETLANLPLLFLIKVKFLQ